MSSEYTFRLRFIAIFFAAILCFTTLSNIFDSTNVQRKEILQEILHDGVSADNLKALVSPEVFGAALRIAFVNSFLFFFILWLSDKRLKSVDRINSLFLDSSEAKFLLVLFGISLFFSATSAYFGHGGGFPMSGDEYAYLTQAKIMAQGRLYVPSHPLKQFFHCDYMVNNGKYFACYPLGAAFFIFLGELLGVPWLANPIVGSLSLVVIYYLLKELINIQIARYGVYFILFCNFFPAMNSGYLSHTASLFFISCWFYLFLTCIKRKQVLRAFGAGICLGGAAFTRPLTALALSSPIMLWELYKLIKQKGPYKLVAAFFAGISIPLSLLMITNKIQTGNPFVLGYQLQFKEPGFQEGYNLIQAIGTMFWRLRAAEYMTNFYPFSFFVILFFLFFAFKGKCRIPYLFLGLLAILCLAYLPLSTSVWELRYYYPPVIYLIGVIPLGLYNFSCYFLQDKWRINYQHAASLMLAVIFIFKVWGIYNWGFTTHRDIAELKRPYVTVKEKGIKNAVIFIQDTKKFYPQWFTRNSLDYGDSVLYVLDLEDENKLLMDYYPKREYYVYNKGSLVRIYPDTK